MFFAFYLALPFLLNRAILEVDKSCKMNTFLRQNWFKIGLLIIVIAVAGGVFYWFQWRPSQIRKECSEKIIEGAKGKSLSANELEIGLDYCLKLYGLSE